MTKRRPYLTLSQALQESERRFQDTFEQAAVGISHVALDGHFLQVNQRLCALVGYPREELLRLSLQDITFPEDVEATLASFRRLLSGESATSSIQKRSIRRDRSLIWINETLSLVRESMGTPCYFISVIEDIQARKLAEEERERLLAREQEARVRAEEINRQLHLLQALTDTALTHMGIDTFVHTLLQGVAEALALDILALFVSGLEGPALYLHTVVGIEPEELPALHCLFGEEMLGRIARERRSQQIADTSVSPLYSPLLQVHILSVLGIPLQFGDQLIGALALATRETHPFSEMEVVLVERVADRLALALERFRLLEAEQRTRLETARMLDLERTNQLLRHFTALMSHEFRTGLTSIQGFCSLLRDDLASLTHEDIAEYVQTIYDSALQLRRMTDDILEQQRMQGGRVTLKVGLVDLQALVTAAVRSIRLTTRQHVFRLEGDASLPPIEGDADKLSQVLLNLLSNAVKYTPNGGQIVVRLQREEAMVHVQIQDQGMGIPSEQLEQIFVPYERVTSETTRYIGGMGLGLSIVHQIVELHKGKVWAESALGKGSVFHVTLPFVSVTKETVGNPSPS